MTPLSLATPLRSLLDAAIAENRVTSAAELGQRRGALEGRAAIPRSAVHVALEQGDSIKLSTLAAYARAAGYVLHIGFDQGADGSWAGVGLAEGLDVTVDRARATLARMGLELILSVEPAPTSTIPSPIPPPST